MNTKTLQSELNLIRDRLTIIEGEVDRLGQALRLASADRDNLDKRVDTLEMSRDSSHA